MKPTIQIFTVGIIIIFAFWLLFGMQYGLEISLHDTYFVLSPLNTLTYLLFLGFNILGLIGVLFLKMPYKYISAIVLLMTSLSGLLFVIGLRNIFDMFTPPMDNGWTVYPPGTIPPKMEKSFLEVLIEQGYYLGIILLFVVEILLSIRMLFVINKTRK